MPAQGTLIRHEGPEVARPLPRVCSSRRHALVAQLLDRLRALRKIGHAHAFQHIRRFRELDVLVADDLDAVAPGIEEIEEAPGQRPSRRPRPAPARTASLSSTTSPKCRPSSPGCLRPFCSAMN